MCQEYNGWSNRFTWLVSLHLDNEPASSAMLLEISNDPTLGLNAKADILKSVTEDIVNSETGYQGRSSMASDLISTALAWVDYREIVEAHIEEAN